MMPKRKNALTGTLTGSTGSSDGHRVGGVQMFRAYWMETTRPMIHAPCQNYVGGTPFAVTGRNGQVLHDLYARTGAMPRFNVRIMRGCIFCSP